MPRSLRDKQIGQFVELVEIDRLTCAEFTADRRVAGLEIVVSVGHWFCHVAVCILLPAKWMIPS